MNGKYKTPEGKEVTILEFDESNSIAFTKFPDGSSKWVGKQEYSTWVHEGKELGTEVDTVREEIASTKSEETTISEVNENPIEEEQKPKPKKKITKQPVKKSPPKKKGKK